jgi:hypothetical protein
MRFAPLCRPSGRALLRVSALSHGCRYRVDRLHVLRNLADGDAVSRAVIEDDEIVIRVPIAALPHAVEVALENEGADPERKLFVANAYVFAGELVHALNAERDRDGSTPVDLMLDKAVVTAIGNGAFGVDERPTPLALAAAARQGGDVKQAPAESPQSGDAKQRNAQPQSRNQ